jgi:beta-galactosidase
MKPKFTGILLSLLVAVLGVAFIIARPARERGFAPISVDAAKPPAVPVAMALDASSKSPDGHEFSLNSRYLTLDGKPWFAVMGEFHYARYPAEDWEREILKMKAGGIQIVSAYVFWIHHEEIEGRFDWSGQRDLRRFVEIAAKAGMYVWVRVGPWNHGEVRNGGLPDWVLRNGPVRGNDPRYLASVRRFYGEIGRQLKGLYWKDGGRIIGVQIENEYHARGAGEGEEHILTLRRMAREAGMDAPFYTITGWDDAVVPARDVIPVFGGYPDGFWYRSALELPPSPHYFFTPIRCEENVGMDLRSKRPDIDARFAGYPFLTAEMGGGMEMSYHRRPLMTADDIAAVDIAKLGSGVALYGYYMFHGGTNPNGRKTTLQESQATGYLNDVPVKSYDFQAPLGEFGQMNPSFRVLKSIHMFLADFGAALAPMESRWPDRSPAGRQDRETPRLAVRSDGNRAFVFINNYQRAYPLPDMKNFQVRVKLSGGAVDVPREPVAIPSGAYTFWPVNMAVGGATLDYATAQLLCRLDEPDTYVFFALPGISAEFAFRVDDRAAIEAPRAKITRQGGRVYVSGIEPGSGEAIRVRAGDGRVSRILILSREEAGNLWKARIGGRDRLILSAADLFFEGGRIQMRATDPAQLAFGVYPGPDRPLAGLASAGMDGVFSRYSASVAPVAITPEVRQLAPAGKPAPVKLGQEVALAPEEADFRAAARWSVRVRDVDAPSVSEVLLRISYQGDIGRLYAGGRLIADDFYHGRPWETGLKRIPRADLNAGLILKILPLGKDEPIYFSAGARPEFGADGTALALKEVRAVPVYAAAADWN